MKFVIPVTFGFLKEDVHRSVGGCLLVAEALAQC